MGSFRRRSACRWGYLGAAGVAAPSLGLVLVFDGEEETVFVLEAIH